MFSVIFAGLESISSRKYADFQIALDENKYPSARPHLIRQVWVSSPHNATGYYTVYGEEALHADHFNTKLSFGDTQTVWARTGYLGFLRRTELTDASGGQSPFVPQSRSGTSASLAILTDDGFCFDPRAP